MVKASPGRCLPIIHRAPGFPLAIPTGTNHQGGKMQILVKSTDPVRLSFLVCLLRDAGIEADILDGHISAVEGPIGAFPRRLAVADDDASRARRVLMEAGEV